MSFDPAQYLALKAKGNIISLVRNGDAITVASKQFSSIDGSLLDPCIDEVSVATQNSQNTAFQSVIDNNNALIADAG